MISISISVTGGADIQAKLDRRSGAQLNKALKEATREAAKAMKLYIAAAAPVSAAGSKGRYPHTRGNLKRSIRVAATRRQTPGAYVGPSRKKAYYRHFVNGGTKHMRANPFVLRGAQAGLGIGLPSFTVGHPNRGDRQRWEGSDGSFAGSDVNQDRIRCRWKGRSVGGQGCLPPHPDRRGEEVSDDVQQFVIAARDTASGTIGKVSREMKGLGSAARSAKRGTSRIGARWPARTEPL